jgi:hypothetical protein
VFGKKGEGRLPGKAQMGMAVIGAVNYVLLRWVEHERGGNPAGSS